MSFVQKFSNLFGGAKQQGVAKGAAKKKLAAKAKKEPVVADAKDKWFQSDGKLAIDLYKAGADIVLRSTIAGIKSDDLEITIQGDIIDIKGVRSRPEEQSSQEHNHFHRECYWGPFSRQVILPEEVDPSRADAAMKGGILTIRVPTIERDKRRTLEIKA